jgi:hypothetical protein
MCGDYRRGASGMGRLARRRSQRGDRKRTMRQYSAT